ncbi:TetR/AcrR family transcriptional regulator [candidate division KSB1 bacterium]|nr:TetR/AcrR family transcriptional regulator [candidate division KSB1 bacterium]MBL7095455.1 TetR/AcrR family transcriptional regulator [candidate division KSB1 bacterium]
MTTFTERQKEIINVSIKLIAEKGIQQLTIKNISKSLGISEPAIYRHFENKLDILLAILSNFKNSSKAAIKRIHSVDRSAIEQIEMMFLTHFKRFAEKPALAAVLFSEEIFQNDKRLSAQVSTIMKLSQQAMSTLIKKGQGNNEIRKDIPEEQLSLIIMGALRLIVKKWKLSNFSFDLEKEGGKLWKSIIKLIESAKKKRPFRTDLMDRTDLHSFIQYEIKNP